MPKINLKKPIYVGGQEATVIFIHQNGDFAVNVPGQNYIRQFKPTGRPSDNWSDWAENEAPVTTEVLILYPNGNVYDQPMPVRSSSYGLDQLVQVRITKQNGRIIKKELLP